MPSSRRYQGERHTYYTGSVAWPGDTFEQMLSKRDYRQKIQSAIFDYFVFSGGGNDLLGAARYPDFSDTRVRPEEVHRPHICISI
jgi:hypothetical protein